MKRNLLAAAILFGLLVPGCESDSPMIAVMKPTEEDMPEIARNAMNAANKLKQAVPVAAVSSDGPGIRKYYFEFLQDPIESKVNVFQANLAAFTPTVEIEAEVEEVEAGPTTPLQYYDADSYKLVLIMSGTATPKALVSDPQGKSYVIMVDTPIGNRNGRVVSITGTEVRIDEPGFPPVVKSLQSDRDEMIKELQSVQEF